MTGHDDLQHDRRPFGHQHLVAELLGPHLVIGDGAGPAIFAIEAEFVIVGRTAFDVLQTVRQQHHAAFERNRQELPFPEGIADQHHREPEVLPGQAQLSEQLPPVLFQLAFAERPRPIERFGIAAGRRIDLLAQGERLRNGFDVNRAPPLPLDRLAVDRRRRRTGPGGANQLFGVARFRRCNRHGGVPLCSPIHPVVCRLRFRDYRGAGFPACRSTSQTANCTDRQRQAGKPAPHSTTPASS